MSKSVALLGRQPALGLAELESLYGSDCLEKVGNGAAVIDKAPDEVNFSQHGGVIKLAKLLTIIDTTDWEILEDYLVKHLPDHVCCISPGKLTLGLSAYGLPVNPKQVNATGLALKKIVRSTGRSCRIVPNKTAVLSSATVLHNKLFTSHNWELLLIRHDKQTYLAQTTDVQDIEAYAARDQARPKRDARVGMLPPKLAQIIINLANPVENSWVLDPFCGTGVVLQEASLMQLLPYGTDINQKMVEYSDENLKWLKPKGGVGTRMLEKADATSYEWRNRFDSIASETYLGRAFSATPKPDTLKQVIRDVDVIHKKFLQNVARQTSQGFRMCIAVPAWKTKTGFKRLPTLEKLDQLGYTRSVFKTVRDSELIYHRPGQVVGRELVVLIRNK